MVMTFILVSGRRHTEAKMEQILLQFHCLDHLIDCIFVVVEEIVGQTSNQRLLEPLNMRYFFQFPCYCQCSLSADIVL